MSLFFLCTPSIKIKGIWNPTFFNNKNKISFYIKVSSTNYKPVLIEKNLILRLRCIYFCEKFSIQAYELKTFSDKFSLKIKKNIKKLSSQSFFKLKISNFYETFLL